MTVVLQCKKCKWKHKFGRDERTKNEHCWRLHGREAPNCFDGQLYLIFDVPRTLRCADAERKGRNDAKAKVEAEIETQTLRCPVYPHPKAGHRRCGYGMHFARDGETDLHHDPPCPRCVACGGTSCSPTHCTEFGEILGGT